MRAADFYAHPERSGSEEIKFGNTWSAEGAPGPWQVTWLVATGELIAFNLAPGGFSSLLSAGGDLVDAAIGVLFFATDEQDKKAKDDEIRILGVRTDRAELDRAIDGWEGRQANPDGLDWLAVRLR